jgi:DNA-binding YbaB/EbfC family protein
MFGNLNDMMGKMQEAQKQAEEIKQRLNNVYVKEESPEISITVNGNRVIKDIEINEILLEDVEELQDKLILALNKALEKANQLNEKEMQGAVKGIIPGM